MRTWLGRVHPTGAILAIAVLALAGALVYHGAVSRYEFANLNPRQVTKRDRLTGHLELCTRPDMRSSLTCEPSVDR